MGDWQDDLERKVADGRLTQGDADAVHSFVEFLHATGGIPRDAADRSPAEQRVFLKAYAEMDPEAYQSQLRRDPRWSGVRGRIGPAEDGVRMVELQLRWYDHTPGVRYMWRPDEPAEPTLKMVLDHMVRHLDHELEQAGAGPVGVGAEPPDPTPTTAQE